MSQHREDLPGINDSVSTKYQWFLDKSGVDFKQHQLDGIVWANEIERGAGIDKGGFIADEMGLGKTIMMIGLFIVNFLPKTLIIVPPILMDQWANEIYRTTGHKAFIYHGTTINPDTAAAFELTSTRNHPIVITTYNMAVRLNSPLQRVDWSRIVFDEAHHLRNKGRRFNGCLTLKAEIRWLVSGTPVQNRRRDFTNLCTILRMDDKTNVPILKRSKADVGIVLPQLTIHDIPVQWTNKNEMMLSENIHHSILTSDCKISMFTMALKSCVLPSLINTSNYQSTNDKLNMDDALVHSSKIDRVVQVVLGRYDRCRYNGPGKIIFCRFRNEIDEIVDRLIAGGMSRVTSFDGRDGKSARAEKLAGSYDAIVMQIQTGCEGLNMQDKYNEVYFVSPHWNPAIEDQAIARCHRIGQTKPVDVFRFSMCCFYKNVSCSESEVDDLENSSKKPMDVYISSIQDKKRRIADALF
jgi:SNF2 family DNA or RNA helicase